MQAEHQVVQAVGVLGAGIQFDHDFRHRQEDRQSEAPGDDGRQQVDRAVLDPELGVLCG